RGASEKDGDRKRQADACARNHGRHPSPQLPQPTAAAANRSSSAPSAASRAVLPSRSTSSEPPSAAMRGISPRPIPRVEPLPTSCRYTAPPAEYAIRDPSPLSEGSMAFEPRLANRSEEPSVTRRTATPPPNTWAVTAIEPSASSVAEKTKPSSLSTTVARRVAGLKRTTADGKVESPEAASTRSRSPARVKWTDPVYGPAASCMGAPVCASIRHNRPTASTAASQEPSAANAAPATPESVVWACEP